MLGLPVVGDRDRCAERPLGRRGGGPQAAVVGPRGDRLAARRDRDAGVAARGGQVEPLPRGTQDAEARAAVQHEAQRAVRRRRTA